MNITYNLQKGSVGTDIRLPKEVVEQAQLSLKEPLTVIIQDKTILLTPLKKKEKITLEKLLSKVTPEDVGGEIDKVVPGRKKNASRYKYLDKLAGSIHIKDKGTTNYAIETDDKYLQD